MLQTCILCKITDNRLIEPFVRFSYVTLNIGTYDIVFPVNV